MPTYLGVRGKGEGERSRQGRERKSKQLTVISNQQTTIIKNLLLQENTGFSISLRSTDPRQSKLREFDEVNIAKS